MLARLLRTLTIRHLQRGCTAVRGGDYAAGIKELTKVLWLDWRNTHAYVDRSYAYSQLGKCDKAIADCNAAIAIDAQNAGAYGNRAVAQSAKGDLAGAIADYDRALELDPNLDPAYEGRGAAHGQSGHYDLAIADFNKALTLNPSLAQSYFGRGLSCLAVGQLENALADFTETLRLQPAFSAAKYQRERAVRMLGFSRLEEFLALPRPDARAVSVPTDKAADYLQRCRRACSDIHRYRSTMVVRDLRSPDLERHAYEVIRWRAEFVGTDASHIYQSSRLENFPDGADDEWIRVGTQPFQKLGDLAACRCDRPNALAIESFLRVETYIKLLDSAPLSALAMHRDAANDCLVVGWSVGSDSHLGDWPVTELRSRIARSLYHLVGRVEGSFVELPHGRSWSPEEWRWPKECAPGSHVTFMLLPSVDDEDSPNSIARNPDLPLRSDYRFDIVLWIAPTQHLIRKTSIELNGQLTNGELVSLQLEQAFGDWDGDVTIAEPELKLNP